MGICQQLFINQTGMTILELVSVSKEFQKHWVLYSRVISVIVGAIVLSAVLWFFPPPSFLFKRAVSEYQLEVLVSNPGVNEQTTFSGTLGNQPDEDAETDQRTGDSEVAGGGEGSDLVDGGKFLVPMLTPYAGTSNQLMEYKAAAVAARSLNRTLCLAKFFRGPSSHLGIGSLVSGLLFQDRYDTESLSRFVKIATIEDCIQNCEDRLDARWRLFHTASRWPRKIFPWFKIQPKVTPSLYKL